MSRYSWQCSLHFESADRAYSVRFELEQDSQEIFIRLPWKPRPDYGVGEHNVIHLEGDDQEYNRFLVAAICTMNRCWDIRSMFGLSPLSLLVGPFRSMESTVRRWAEVCGEPTEALKRDKQQRRTLEPESRPTRLQVFVCFLRALADGHGKVAASRIVARRFGCSDAKAYKIAGKIIERRPDLFRLPCSNSGYSLSAAGHETLERLEQQADGGRR